MEPKTPAAKPHQHRLNVQSDPETASGVYSNMMTVNHRKEEFILDFFFMQPMVQGQTDGVANLRSRVIVTPEHLKRISNALSENIRKYEEKFGAIRESDDFPRALH